jgi:hypothetical protein
MCLSSVGVHDLIVPMHACLSRPRCSTPQPCSLSAALTPLLLLPSCCPRAQAADVAHSVGDSVTQAVEYIKERLPEVHLEHAGGFLQGLVGWWVGATGWWVVGVAASRSPLPISGLRCALRRAQLPPSRPLPTPCLQTPLLRMPRVRHCWTRQWKWPLAPRHPSAPLCGR